MILPRLRFAIFIALLAVVALHSPAARAGEPDGEATTQNGDAPADATFQSTSVWPPEMELINSYRAAAGVRPAEINPSLDSSASSHVRYYDANRGDPSLAGMGLHSETPGRPGFTGATMGNRARAAGYSGGTVTENAGYGSFAGAVDWYMNSVNHRLPLIHPSALDMGYAESPESRFSIVSVGLRHESVQSPSLYPGPDAQGVPTSWDGSETPNPAPGLARPLGYPITVAFGVSQRVAWSSFSLSGPEGEPVEFVVSRTDWMRAAAIIPTRPLQPGATYTVQVEATVDGKPFSKEWSFTTAG
ncbi:MAG TPA: CAP domain-containing protein [Chloroflexota bacterium]|nr:CAP domain-containing protein [Chloroflexota bacterium]